MTTSHKNHNEVIPIKTHDKLNTLLLLCGISSVRMARALNVDASLVSRWRSGSRRPKPEYCQPLAERFAEHIVETYQQHALANLLNYKGDCTKLDQETLSKMICQWLQESDCNTPEEMLLPEAPLSEQPPADNDIQQEAEGDLRLFPGVSGFYEAMIALLQIIGKKNKPSEIIIFMDDPPSWLNDENVFIRQMLARIYQYRRRLRISFICPRISRAENTTHYLDNILALCRYANASIYQFTTYRPGKFPQLAAIAPGLGAVVKLGFNQHCAALITEKATLKVLNEEFHEILEQSQTLFRNLGANQSLDILSSSTYRHQQRGTIYSFCGSLPQITMPMELLNKIAARGNLEQERVSTFVESALPRHRAFLHHLEGDKHYMVVELAPAAEILSGQTPICQSELYFGKELYYSPEEYAEHLRYLLDLIKKYPNLSISCTERPWSDLQISAMSGVSTVIHRIFPPCASFFAMDNEVSEQLYLYMEHEYEDLSVNERNRLGTINKLRALLKEIEPVS